MMTDKINILIIGLGNIGQQTTKELCAMRLRNKISLNKIYILNKDKYKLNAIREDILSSTLLIAKREKIDVENYLAVEEMLQCADLSENLSLSIVILSFGVKISEHIDYDKVLHTSQRHTLFLEHKKILDSLTDQLMFNLQPSPLLINIVNPIEEICKYLVVDYGYNNNKVIGCSAELDSTRGYKYLLRNCKNTYNIESFCYLGKHNETGKYILANDGSSSHNIIEHSDWSTMAQKEGGNILYHNKKPPIFGPSESILNLVTALLTKNSETLMSCSVWDQSINDFSSYPIIINNLSFRHTL
tara:strand:+ start:933 stop:1835 length:903 start_codon:yes stop_codon:yes gene_type:complete